MRITKVRSIRYSNYFSIVGWLGLAFSLIGGFWTLIDAGWTAVEELETGGFHQAKTHMAGVTPPTGEYVLCLYYKDDSRKDELATKYRNRSELKYRYWKSDEDTLTGKYSKEFLDKLSPAERNLFQRKT
jgi:hypothetical protein